MIRVSHSSTLVFRCNLARKAARAARSGGIDSDAGFVRRTRTGFPQANSSFACEITNRSISCSEIFFCSYLPSYNNANHIPGFELKDDFEPTPTNGITNHLITVTIRLVPPNFEIGEETFDCLFKLHMMGNKFIAFEIESSSRTKLDISETCSQIDKRQERDDPQDQYGCPAAEKFFHRYPHGDILSYRPSTASTSRSICPRE